MSRSIRAALAFSCFLLPATAQAAPQILALVETESATELACADGVCAAEFSAFCLQENRPSPAEGTVYTAIGEADIRLILTLPDGSVRERAAGSDLQIVSVRGYSALRLTVPQQVLRESGATAVALSVGQRVALAPQVARGDPHPITPEELALASGPLRTAGQVIVDHGGKSAVTARITNALINAMSDGRMPDPNERQSLWQEVAGLADGASSPGRKQALWAYEACWNIVENAGGNGLRGCLQRYHDIVMQGLTTKYWDAHKAGS